MWSDGITDTEARAAVTTVRDFVRGIHDVCAMYGLILGPTQIRPFGTWIIQAIPRGDPYWGTQWYVESATDRQRGQIIAPRFLELVRREPWQQAMPHFDLAIMEADLWDEPERALGTASDPFVLSACLPGIAAVISVHRLRGIPDLRNRISALRRLIVHNLGHVLEVPAVDRENAVDSVGGERHCANHCVMRHTTGIDHLIALADQERSGPSFCEACRRDLVRSAILQRLSNN